MLSNRGSTTLRRRGCARNPMREFDRLPPVLRRWMADAALPWRAKTVLAAYHKAMAKTGNPKDAISVLDEIQSRLVAKDARKIWGLDHPAAR